MFCSFIYLAHLNRFEIICQHLRYSTGKKPIKRTSWKAHLKSGTIYIFNSKQTNQMFYSQLTQKLANCAKSFIALFQRRIVVCIFCTASWLQAGMTCSSTTSCTEGTAVWSWRSYSGSPQCDAEGGRWCPWWISTWPTSVCPPPPGWSPEDSQGQSWLSSLVCSASSCPFLQVHYPAHSSTAHWRGHHSV